MASIWLEGLELFCTEDRATLKGRPLALSHMERQLLLYLAQNPHETLTRERLLREVWGYAAMGATRTIDSHVKKLRAHMGGCGKYIVTVRGQGYRLEPPPGQVLSCESCECARRAAS